MTKFRGFNNSVIRIPKRKLNRPQVKQVQKIIQANKRIKNSYTYIGVASPAGFELNFTDVTGATPIATAFGELTLVPQNNNSVSRSELMIQLQSYNIKMGLDWFTNDAGTPSTLLIAAPFRVLIVRSKRGPQTDIVDRNGTPITTFYEQPDPDIYQIYTDEIISVSGNNSSTTQENISPGYLWHFYKSFKNKKVPHMLVGYDEDPFKAVNNPIYMKVLVSPNAPAAGESYNFALRGFCHLKFFDKE